MPTDTISTPSHRQRAASILCDFLIDKFLCSGPYKQSDDKRCYEMPIKGNRIVGICRVFGVDYFQVTLFPNDTVSDVRSDIFDSIENTYAFLSVMDSGLILDGSKVPRKTQERIKFFKELMEESVKLVKVQDHNTDSDPVLS